MTDHTEGEARIVHGKYDTNGAGHRDTNPAGPDFVCLPKDLLIWAVERWNAEVRDRPLKNIHRRSLDDTWRQVIRKLGGNPDELIGPDHDTLLLARASMTGHTELLREARDHLMAFSDPRSRDLGTRIDAALSESAAPQPSTATVPSAPSQKGVGQGDVAEAADQTRAEALARLFHDTYERLAPLYGYTTREETRQFDPKSPNGQLMIAVCQSIKESIADPASAALRMAATRLLELKNLKIKVEQAEKEGRDAQSSRAYYEEHKEQAWAALSDALNRPASESAFVCVPQALLVELAKAREYEQLVPPMDDAYGGALQRMDDAVDALIALTNP